MVLLGKRVVRGVNDPTIRHRIHRVVPNHDRRLVSQGWTVDCCHEECETNNEGSGGQIVVATQAVVRFRLGFVNLWKGRNKFTPMFVANDAMEYEVFAHANCALDGGLNIEQLRTDVCSICDCHFYCEVEPKETIVHVEHGEINIIDDQGNYEFEPGLGGYIHWACARHWWDDDLFDGLEGDKDASTIEGEKGDDRDYRDYW